SPRAGQALPRHVGDRRELPGGTRRIGGDRGDRHATLMAVRDDFARDNLPPREQWPDLLLDGLDYPERLNCVTELLDRHILVGNGDRPCLRSPTETWSYADLLSRV